MLGGGGRYSRELLNHPLFAITPLFRASGRIQKPSETGHSNSNFQFRNIKLKLCFPICLMAEFSQEEGGRGVAGGGRGWQEEGGRGITDGQQQENGLD